MVTKKQNAPKLTIEPKQLAFKPLSELVFDPNNPRFPHDHTGSNDQSALKWMLENANIIELMHSIGEQGFFVGEPLIVVPSSKNKGKFEVMEGNRRLTAVKLLGTPTLAPTKKKAVQEASDTAEVKPEELPCLVFEKKEDVLHFLAFRHVTGVQAWNPLQKARYLRTLAKTPGFFELDRSELRRKLAREIGTRPDYVGKLMAGLAVYDAVAEESFFNIPGLEDAEGWYSVLTTAVTSYSNIAQFLGLEGVTDDDSNKIDVGHLKKLTEWLFKKNSQGVARVRESRDLQKLSRVVANAAALEKFEAGVTLDDADLLTEGPLEAFRETLRLAKSRLELARDLLPKMGGIINKHDLEQISEIKILGITIEASAKSISEHM